MEPLAVIPSGNCPNTADAVKDLPEPDAPRSATRSLGAIRKETPATSARPRKDTVRSCTTRADVLEVLSQEGGYGRNPPGKDVNNYSQQRNPSLSIGPVALECGVWRGGAALLRLSRGRAATVLASAGLRRAALPLPVGLFFGLLADFARRHALSPCLTARLAPSRYVNTVTYESIP